MSDDGQFHTISELPQFQRMIEERLSEVERYELINFLALHPDAGAVVQGAGGARKLRWVAAGRGKRGGARVIYYFMNATKPLYLIAIYLKSEKSDLSHRERQLIAEICGELKDV